MTKLNKVEGFEEGDIITVIERLLMWDRKIKTLTHKFEIIRNKPKTYECKYIEGPYKSNVFDWVKGYDLTKNVMSDYYID